MKNVIELTAAEIQSGLDRVKWAENLIRQLPEDHDGRNSWLMSYARVEEPSPEEKRLHLIRNACSEIHQAVEHYNVSIDCSAAMRAVIEAMIDAGYRKP